MVFWFRRTIELPKATRLPSDEADLVYKSTATMYPHAIAPVVPQPTHRAYEVLRRRACGCGWCVRRCREAAECGPIAGVTPPVFA